MPRLELLLQVEWPELDVMRCRSPSSGRRSRCPVRVRAMCSPRGRHRCRRRGFAFPRRRRSAACAPRPATSRAVFRMSYSGELRLRDHVPPITASRCGKRCSSADEGYGIMPYGTEAMSTLRIEKGHVSPAPSPTGAPLPTISAWAGSSMRPSGASASRCSIVPRSRARRWQLVGLTCSTARIPRGAQARGDPDRAAPDPMEGHVTSWCCEPVTSSVDRAGPAGTRARASRRDSGRCRRSPTRGWRCASVPPCFIDPEGERLRG